MSFHAFFFGLSIEQREDLASRAGTTRGVLNQVAYRNKAIELGFADVLVALAPAFGGRIAHGDLLLTDKAERQKAIRDGSAQHQTEEQGA